MIIVRSPLRITLGGGGTDLPSYYRDYGGFLVAAAIDTLCTKPSSPATSSNIPSWNGSSKPARSDTRSYVPL